jgi:hypothetical protein
MCGQGHHSECDCHGGSHREHHGSHEVECDCHEEREGECQCNAGECGCHGDSGDEFHFERRFVTRSERIAQLEAYLEDLQAEAQAVQERIAEMKAVNA